MGNYLRSLGTIVATLLIQGCGQDDVVAPRPTPEYGQVRLNISTDGVDIDPSGHQIMVEVVGGNGAVPEYQGIPLNGSWTIRLRASATYDISLVRLSANCVTVESDTWHVTVATDQVTDISFGVTCSRIEGILVTEGTPSLQALDLVYADGSDLRPMGEGSAATWAPNGEFMIYVAPQCQYVQGDEENYTCVSSLVLSTLHGARSLWGGWAGSFPAWHPDGDFIVFLDRRDLHRVGLGGFRTEFLARLPVDSAADLEWSRDGTHLAFTCFLVAPPSNGAPARSDICAVEADGSGFEVLTNEPGSHAQPAWHPDGDLAFATTRFGEVSIATMHPDGSGIARLTAGSDPAWSKDGSRLAVIRSGVQPGLYAVNRDGSGEQFLANGHFAAPAWRP